MTSEFQNNNLSLGEHSAPGFAVDPSLKKKFLIQVSPWISKLKSGNCYHRRSPNSMPEEKQFIPVSIAVLTVSDSRTEATDKSGQLLCDRLKTAGHHLAEKMIVPDDIYQIRAIVSRWIADSTVQAIITTGGTGVTGRDGTPEAVQPLLDKELEGFGEIFRMISYQEIKTSTIQSRALAGVANRTYIFCLPGSSGACRTGWDQLIHDQLDSRHAPCNLVKLMPRLRV